MNRIYTIPKWNINKFEKQLKALQRKGFNFSYEDLGAVIEDVNGVDYICEQYSVENEPVYKMPGWEFIGSLEHKEAGNIIRGVKDIEIPKYYYTAPCKCDHCNTNRRRNDTYLVRKDNGEFKQVGRACLKDYTGLNPANCVAALDFEVELAKMQLNAEEVAMGGFNTYGAFRGFDATRIKRLAYNEIKKNGYRKNTEEGANGKLISSTKDIVINSYSDTTIVGATDAELAEVNNWVGFLDVSHNDYYRNATTAYVEDIYEARDLALVISLISCYFKDIAKQKEKAAREELQKKNAQASQEVGYLGEVGDKVEFEVATDSILFVNNPYTYYGSFSYTHKIIDNQGHVILWTTSADTSEDKEFMPGIKIKATIKAKKEFRGELQTVVTRGKLI